MPQFHPKVRSDVSAALPHYDSIHDTLGDDFWAEFEFICSKIDSNPKRFHFDPSGWRRANFRRFPYHVLFSNEIDGVRVMALRHNHRNPKFGLKRK